MNHFLLVSCACILWVHDWPMVNFVLFDLCHRPMTHLTTKIFFPFSLLSDYTIFQIFSFILPLNCSLLDSMEIVRVSRQHNLAQLKFCKRQNTFIYFLLYQMYISNFLLNLGSFLDFEFYDLFSSYKFVKIMPD